MQTIEVSSKSSPGKVVTRYADGHAPKDFWVGALTDANLGPVRLFVDAVVVHQ